MAYEILFGGRSDRIRAIRSMYQDETAGPRLTEALRAMLGSRWEEAYRPIPELAPAQLDRMTKLVSLSHRQAFERFASGLWMLIAGMFALPLIFALSRIVDSILAVVSILPEAAVLVVLGVRRLWVDGKAAQARLEAISQYFQIRDYRRKAGLEGPDFDIHPEYRRFDPDFVRQSPEVAELERSLASWKKPVAWVLLGTTVLPLGTFAAALLLRLPFSFALIAVLLSMIAAVPIVAVTARGMKTSTNAYSQLKSLIREKWRTGTPILPPDFRMPKGYRLFRAPPALTDRDLRRMRIANRFGSPRFIAIMVAVVMSAVFVPLGASITLGVRGLPIVFAIFVPLGAFAAFSAWAGGGNALLGQLREYEETSGKQVLPPDLHVRPQQPVPRWRP